MKLFETIKNMDDTKTTKILFGLFKIKKSFLWKKYYIFGIQIFRKRNIKTLYLSQINNFVFSVWFREGATQELLNYLKLLSQSAQMLENLPNQVWLVYLSCLLRFNHIDEARWFLKIYQYYHSDKDIEKFIIVSNFVKQNGKISEIIDKSANVWKHVCNRTNINEFEEYLKNKTIAIVGGSGCELGKNKGAEIDSHDIVIRFANYPTDEKYFCDYGQKTNVWVRQSSVDLIHKPDISEYAYVFWKEDFERLIIMNEHTQIINDYYDNYNKKLVLSETKYYNELYKTTGIYRPTAGCFVIWYLYNVLGSLKNVDIYGFSFLSKDYSDTKHYFDNVCKLATNHDMKMEIDFLHGLYNKKKEEIRQ